VARADDRNAFVIALAHTAAELLLLGRRDDAARALHRLDDAAQTGLSPLAEGWRLRVHAIEAISDGDAVACLALSERSVACFEACGERREVAGGRSNVGFGQISVGRIADAEATLRRALAITLEMGTVRTTTIVTQNLALAVLFAGRPEEALQLAEDAERMAREQDAPRIAGAAVLYQARALLASGDAAEAHRRAERAVVALADVPPTRAYALGVVAEARLALAEPAVELAASAVALADQLGGIDEGDAYVRWVLARALIATGADASAVIGNALDRLSVVAARISDADGLAAFWDGVPEHRALRALADAR
jgi:tetratricopeptide (TPR) repeat protein